MPYKDLSKKNKKRGCNTQCITITLLIWSECIDEYCAYAQTRLELALPSPVAQSKCAQGAALLHFSLLWEVSLRENATPWRFRLLTLPPQGSALPAAPHPEVLFLALSHSFRQRVPRNLDDSDGALLLCRIALRNTLRNKTGLIAQQPELAVSGSKPRPALHMNYTFFSCYAF